MSSLLEAAYSPLPIDRVFYDKVANSGGRELVESFVLPIRSGKAWKVFAGQLFRISTPEGPQVIWQCSANLRCSKYFDRSGILTVCSARLSRPFILP
jgi:hypothetical protein